MACRRRSTQDGKWQMVGPRGYVRLGVCVWVGGRDKVREEEATWRVRRRSRISIG